MNSHVAAAGLTVLLAAALGAPAPAANAPLPPQKYDLQYARDRAEIEDLQARYLFALDWQDEEAYAATFAPDGVLDWAGGVARGRDAIRAEARNMRAGFAKAEAAAAPLRPARLRHLVTNIVIRIDGDRATSVAEWFEINNDNRPRWPQVQGYGHFEDEYRRVDGRWLISNHKIFNEALPERTAGARNPAPPP